MLKPYDHQAIEWIEDGHRECRICGDPVTGIADTLRHMGEAFRPAAIDPADRPTVEAATSLGAMALEEMLTDRVSDHDRARIIVERLHRAGMLNTARRRTRVAA